MTIGVIQASWSTARTRTRCGSASPGIADGGIRLRHENPILTRAETGAHLTRDLLMFSRKQPLDLKPVDLNGIIQKHGRFLVRVIGRRDFLGIAARKSDVEA